MAKLHFGMLMELLFSTLKEFKKQFVEQNLPEKVS